jgi:hypothetical protein
VPQALPVAVKIFFFCGGGGGGGVRKMVTAALGERAEPVASLRCLDKKIFIGVLLGYARVESVFRHINIDVF